MNILTRFSRRYLGAGTAGSIERRVELLVIVLALVLLAQWLVGGINLVRLATPAAIAPDLDGAGAERLVSLERVNAAQREEMGARPLFWVSRRPETPAAGAAGNAGSGRGRLNDVTIVGVFGSGGAAGAIARVGEQETRILLGEELQGWKLEAVHPNGVEFERSGLRTTLFLTPGKNDSAREKPASRQPRHTAPRRAPDADTRPARANESKQVIENQKQGESSARQLGWGRVTDE